MKFKFWQRSKWCNRWQYILRQVGIWFVVGLLVTILVFPYIARSQTNPTERATQMVQQGQDFYNRDRFDLAVTQWQQAVGIYQKQDNRLQQARVLTYLSLAQQKLEQWSKAEAAIATSIQLLNSLEHNTAESQLVLAQTLNAKGAVLLALGKFETALDIWQQATQVYRNLHDETGITGSLINQAQALEKLGFYRRTCKVIFLAVNSDYGCDFTNPNDWKMVLESFDRLPEKLKILGLQNLGNILRQLGDWQHSERVLKYSWQFQQSPQEKTIISLDLGRLNRDRYKQARNLYSKTYLSNIQQEARKTALNYATRALSNYRQAIEIAEKEGAKDLALRARLFQLSLSIDLQQWGKDVGSEIDALVDRLIDSKIGDRPASYFTIQAQLNFARSLMEIESRQSIAIDYINRAQIQAKQLSDLRSQSYAWGILGSLWANKQDWSKAEEYSQLALNDSVTINATDLNAQWRAQLGSIYRVRGKIEQAIAISQDAINDFNTLRQDLISSERDLFFLQQDVETIYRNLIELFLNDTQNNSISQADLNQTIKIIDSLRIREVENFLNCNLAAEVSLNEQEIDSTAALIYPIILKNRLEIVVRLPHSSTLQHYSILVSKEELESTSIQWRTELERRFISTRSLTLSQKIYNWTIEPLKETLERAGIKTLVFVLDGGLRNLPMAALYDGREYLLEQYAIASVPGLKLLPPPRTRNKHNVLAFGLTEIRSNFPPHKGFGELVNVKTELNKIGERLTAKKYLNQEFTSDNLKQRINSVDFPILHLATHGQLSSESAKTFLLAWDKRIDLNNLSTILQQNSSRAIELLVLSACQTAAGDNRAIVGLAGIAIESGANSTLASLWNVQDSSTAQLMSWFYRGLSQGKSKAEALRQAQVELSHTPGYRAPFYWSPYVLLGNWL